MCRWVGGGHRQWSIRRGEVFVGREQRFEILNWDMLFNGALGELVLVMKISLNRMCWLPSTSSDFAPSLYKYNYEILPYMYAIWRRSRKSILPSWKKCQHVRRETHIVQVFANQFIQEQTGSDRRWGDKPQCLYSSREIEFLKNKLPSKLYFKIWIGPLVARHPYCIQNMIQSYLIQQNFELYSHCLLSFRELQWAKVIQ